MKKILAMVVSAAMLATMLAGCGGGNNNSESGYAGDNSSSTSNSSTSNSSSSEETSGGSSASGTINVVSREDGSGTRGAFVELFGIEEENESGETVDMTTLSAEITNSTSVMMTTIAGNVNAIGYVSLGSLDESVKAVKIDGAEATVDNIKSGTYKVSRPFNIATMGEPDGVAADFINFIMSEEGQAVVEEEGYISEGNNGAFTSTNPSGSIMVGGSSSVTPVMEKLKEAYEAINTNATIEVQQNDSTTGMTSAIDGVVDIGMASRELKDSELEAGLTPTTIAIDGIAVIVNNENSLDELTSEQVKSIFTGEVTDWSEIA